ncbi:hypothetical protein Tco_0773471 [Tanacetum coccineum]|uniref:Uncharacterized protein n=1 Tax=Tanacetum coccineum TaxID=301880 RepID=A0ABQ4ZPA7_9ASTR
MLHSSSTDKVHLPEQRQRGRQTKYTSSESVSEEDSVHEQEGQGNYKRIWHSCKVFQKPLQTTNNKKPSNFFKSQEHDCRYTPRYNNDNQSSYMAKIQDVSPEESSSTGQPLEQVQNHNESNVYDNVRRHSEQPESINDTYVLEKDDSNVTPDSSNICY